MEMKIFVFSVVAFDTIKIYTCWAYQNDCNNCSFVKDINVVDKKDQKWSYS